MSEQIPCFYIPIVHWTIVSIQILEGSYVVENWKQPHFISKHNLLWEKNLIESMKQIITIMFLLGATPGIGVSTLLSHPCLCKYTRTYLTQKHSSVPEDSHDMQTFVWEIFHNTLSFLTEDTQIIL